MQMSLSSCPISRNKDNGLWGRGSFRSKIPEDTEEGDNSEFKKKSNQKPKTNTQLISVYKSQLKEMETKNKQTKNSTKKKEEEKRTQAQTHLLKLKSNRKK